MRTLAEADGHDLFAGSDLIIDALLGTEQPARPADSARRRGSVAAAGRPCWRSTCPQASMLTPAPYPPYVRAQATVAMAA